MPTVIPGGMNLPISSANSLDGERMPSALLAALNADIAASIALETRPATAEPMPEMIPVIMLEPIEPHSTFLKALATFVTALFASSSSRDGRLSTAFTMFVNTAFAALPTVESRPRMAFAMPETALLPRFFSVFGKFTMAFLTVSKTLRPASPIFETMDLSPSRKNVMMFVPRSSQLKAEITDQMASTIFGMAARICGMARINPITSLPMS